MTQSTDAASLQRAVRRNTLLLAVTMAVMSAMFQLVAAVSALTFALVTGVSSLLGLGPALFLVSSAVTAFPAGRLMDRAGRIPVLAGGFAVGLIGALVTAGSVYMSLPWLMIPGFLLMGAAGATAQLARTAAADMYPPQQRARGVSYVMFGAVSGAILGPLVFAPFFRGRELTAEALALAWLIGGALLLLALTIVLFVRPDPRRIAEAVSRSAGAEADAFATSRPHAFSVTLGAILRRPGAAIAVTAGVISYSVMVAVMNLAGYVVVGHRGHAQHVVFPLIGAHVLGMYLFMPVVGLIVDRAGRALALSGGLVLLAIATSGIIWFDSVAATAVLLFLLGLGWNFSFVAATTQLADLAAPHERGRLLGFNDLVAGFSGATFVLAGGYALADLGVAALALSAAVVSLLPIAVILRRPAGHGIGSRTAA